MKADIIIEGGLLVTMDANRSVIDNGVVVINKGVIVDCGDSSVLSKYEATQTIRANGKLVMPGLINTHTHTGNTIYRGIADDLRLQDWLQRYIFPLEAKFCNKDTVRLSAQLSIIEMLRSGTTTFCDMYYFEQQVAEVAKQIGMRCELAETIIDFPGPAYKTSAEEIQQSEELIKTWKDDELVTIGIGPHAIYTCSDDTLKKAKALADKYKKNFFLHLSETKMEVDDCLKKNGVSPVEHLEKLGLLEGGNVFAVHCVHISERDREIFQKRGIGVSYNPQSNMKLASGVAPIPDLLKRGIPVGLGTDGAASNNTLNLFEEMDMGTKLQKIFTGDASVMNAQTMVEMTTVTGSKLLHQEKEIGVIEKGRKADVILIDLTEAHLIPFYDPYSTMVYAMNGSEVDTVIVNGKILMEKKQLKTIEEEAVLAEVRALAKKIRKEF